MSHSRYFNIVPQFTRLTAVNNNNIICGVSDKIHYYKHAISYTYHTYQCVLR